MAKILPLVLAVLLIFNTLVVPPKKTEAIAPVLLYIAGAVVGEVATDLGWKYIGKPAFKKVKDLITKKITDKPENFDFTKKKPKKKGNKIDIDISPLDRAKIASELNKEAKKIIEADRDRRTKMTDPSYDVDFADTDPFYNTGLKLKIDPYDTSDNKHSMVVDYIQRMYHIEFTPQAYEMASKVELIDSVSGERILINVFPGGTPYNVINLVGKYDDSGYSDYLKICEVEGYCSTLTQDDSYYGKTSFKIYKSFLDALELSNRTIYMAEGLMVPEDNTKVYNVPLETPSTYVLPNSADLDIDISIPLNIENDSTEIELEWEDLDIYQTDIDNYITQIEDRGDVTINNYQNITYNVNNYYISNYYDKTPEEVDDEIDDILPDPTNPDDPEVPEDKNDPNSIWDDIIPIAIFLVFLELLISIIMYMARMLEFILTIPFIEAIPINNAAFEWFKTAKIMGVQIYEVVSLMATVGLSFLVYKAIKKVLP